MAFENNIYMPEEIKYIKRKVHYHELHLEFMENYNPGRPDNDQFLGFFSAIALLATTRDTLRYQSINEAKIFVQDVLFNDERKKITGKLRYVRTDLWPEIINVNTDETKDIEGEEFEGIVETTHFVIDYSRATKKIAIEYNHVGAKITDFISYCDLIGKNKQILEAAAFIPIAKNELSTYNRRIKKCSGLFVRIHRDNIPAIAQMDNQLYTAITYAKEQFEAEYVELHLRFKYGQQTIQRVRTSVTNLITSLTQNRRNAHLFETLKVKAQDEENSLRIKMFDLLVDKVESEIEVQRKPKHKVIISLDILEKIIVEMISKRI